MPNEEEKKLTPEEEETEKCQFGSSCCAGETEEPKEEKAEECGCGCGCGCEEGGCHCDENGTEVCESDCGCQCHGASTKKRKLVLVSAILAIIAGIVSFASAMASFLGDYSTEYQKAIGYGNAATTLLFAAVLITFATFAIIHLAKGSFKAKWLYPAVSLGLGGMGFVLEIVNMVETSKEKSGTSASWAVISLYFILSLALVVSGILYFVLGNKCKKCQKIFFFVSVGLALFTLVFQLSLYLTNFTLTTLPFSAFLIETLLTIAIEILGLLIMVGEGQLTMKEDKEAAETLLAYQELLEKEVITEEEFEEKKEEILR